MNLQEFSALYDRDKWITKEQDRKAYILLPENCYNPEIIKTAIPNNKFSVNELNESYFASLTCLREAIESKNIEDVISALGNFHYEYFAYSYPEEFKDFLNFDGLFLNCQWFKASNDDNFPEDIICTETNKPSQRIFSTFINLDTRPRPKNKLKEFFNGRENIDTLVIGSLKFENPFSQILRGEIEDKTFYNAIECLNDSDFDSEWMSKRITLSKKSYSLTDIGKLIYKTEYNDEKTYRNKINTLMEKESLLLVPDATGTKHRLNISVLKKLRLLSETDLDSL
jgi:hypothetical protein